MSTDQERTCACTYNHGSVEGVAYSYDYANKEFVTGLPILPSLGVKGEF